MAIQKTAKDLQKGEDGVILRVEGTSDMVKRLSEMGFVKGKKITCIQHTPLRGPIEFQILDSLVVLRKTEAQHIVISQDIVEKTVSKPFSVELQNPLENKLTSSDNQIHIALVGNPNTGKTSIYNHLSHTKEHVGNYSGVTVNFKTTTFNYNGFRIKLVDLPGTYSLHQDKREEEAVRNYIIEEKPDIIINVLDASNLERNLFLTTQLIEMEADLVIALNMYDELLKKNIVFDYPLLSERIHIPIIPTIGHDKQSMEGLLKAVTERYQQRKEIKKIRINYPHEIEKSIDTIIKNIPTSALTLSEFSERYIAVLFMEQELDRLQKSLAPAAFEQIRQVVAIEVAKIEKQTGESCQTAMIDGKYAFIAGCLSDTYQEGHKSKHEESKKIDYILTNKYLGLPLLFGFLFLMFHTTFSLGKYPAEWIETAISYFSNLMTELLPDSIFQHFLVDGMIAGLGSVLMFLPNIIIVFLFISFMEDTGYIARTTFIMDKLMHKIGLHGKSFIPMLLGFGCNVPAILATKMLENKKDRILTILIIPFMACSARLPIFILLIAFISPAYPTLTLFGLYLFGILVAIATAIIFNKCFFKGQSSEFIVELPPYRLPQLKNTVILVTDKVKGYLKSITPVIIIASTIIWALGYFPRHEENNTLTTITNDSSLTQTQKVLLADSLKRTAEEYQITHSFIGQLGKAIEPAIEPLGFDWKMGIALLGGVAAKEIVVSTMSILYTTTEDNLEHTLQKITDPNTQQPFFTPLRTLSFLIFILLYFPCISVILVIYKEIGWKWAILTVIYSTTAAWVLSFLFFNIGHLIV